MSNGCSYKFEIASRDSIEIALLETIPGAGSANSETRRLASIDLVAARNLKLELEAAVSHAETNRLLKQRDRAKQLRSQKALLDDELARIDKELAESGRFDEETEQ